MNTLPSRRASISRRISQVLLADTGYAVLSCAGGSALHLYTLNGHLVWTAPLSAGVSSLALSPCQTSLLCGFDDGHLCAWSLHDRAVLAEYEPCPAPIVCLVIADGKLLAATARAELIVYAAPATHVVLCPGIQVNPTAGVIHVGFQRA